MGKKKKKKLKVKRKRKGEVEKSEKLDFNKLIGVIGDIEEGLNDIYNNDVVEMLNPDGYKALCELLSKVESIINSTNVMLEDMEQEPYYKMSETTIKHLKGLVK